MRYLVMAATWAALLVAVTTVYAQDQKHRVVDLPSVQVPGFILSPSSPPSFGTGVPGHFGAGSMHTHNNHQPTADKTKSKQPCPDFEGDPVSLENGYKIDSAVDFSLPGDMGLKFERFYLSKNVHGTTSGGWTDNLDYTLSCPTTRSCNTLTFRRPDGSELSFISNDDNTFSEVGGGGFASATYSPAGMAGEPGYYTVHDEDSKIYTWSQAPNSNLMVLKYISDVTGMLWTISKSGSTTTVRHTNGQAMTLTTSMEGSLSILTVKDPMGNAYVYKSVPNAPRSVGVLPMALGTVTLPGSPATTIGYRYAAGLSNAISEVDYNGVPHDLTDYDSAGRVHQTRMADGTQATTIVYGSNSIGATATVTNALGHVSVYQFNPKGQLSSITGQASARCAATFSEVLYDAEGNLSSSKDSDGNVTQYTYASTGLLTRMEEASGTALARTTTYVWDTPYGIGRVLSATVAGWSKTSYTYNAQNRIASRTIVNLSAMGVPNQALTTSYRYTLYDSGVVHTLSVIHPSPNQGDVDVFTYDTLGNLISVVDALGHATTYGNYNALGEPGRVVGPNGDRVDYGYDARGRVTSRTTYPGGVAATWAYGYDGFGLLSSVAAPDGEITTTVRNAEMQVTQITRNDKDGTSTETFGHDANGDITSDTVTRNGTVSLARTTSYDELGRPHTRQGAHGQSLTYSYDGNGNVTKVTDALNHATTMAYDARNRLSKSTDAAGEVTAYTYDTGDHLTTVTDPRGLITAYNVDGLGQLWGVSSPDTGTTTYAYDAYGRRTGMTRANDVVTTYAYDAINRRISVSAGGSTRTFAYDSCANGLGRLCSASDATSSTAYAYTPEGQIASRRFTLGGTAYALGYAYDAMGQLTALTYPDGRQARYRYSHGAVSGITFAAGSTQLTAASGVTWQPMDTALASWIASNGLANTLSYDTDGRLVGIHVPGVESLGFSYDAANRLTGIDNAIDGTQSQDFGYDEQSRLVAMTSGRAVASYGYDADGNRVTTGVDNTPGTAMPTLLNIGGGPIIKIARVIDTTSYSTTSNHMTSTIGADAQSYGYDALGNVTALNGVTTYQYDAFNRLSAAAGTSYTISPEGQRLRKSGGAGTTYFAPDASGTLLAEDDNGSWIDYVWLGGRLIGRAVNGQLEAIGDDQLGRPQVVTNAAQQVVWSALNWPFTRGVLVDNTAPLNLGFPGQYYDAETGLWNNGFRDYDPTLGRYVESDPLGLAAGVNTYAYVGGNPLSYTDPYGLWEWPSLPQGFVDASAGFGDALSFGLTGLARKGLGIGSVNECSGSYKGGQAAGIVASFIDGEGEANIAFQSAHYADRLAEAGLDAGEVEAAVAGEVNATLSSASEGTAVGPFSGRIMVNDVQVEYRAYPLSGGQINVGTIFPVK